MALFWLRRVGSAFHADGNESVSEIEKLPAGKSLLVEVRLPRNAGQHKLYWTLCARIGEAIGQPSEVVSDMLKIATGHCDVVKSKKYGEVRLPKSISWAKMDQTQFREFFDRCVQTITEEWGIARADVLEAVSDLIGAQA